MNGGTNFLKRSAPANVGNRSINIGVSRLGLLSQQCSRRHDHSALAVATLGNFVLDPGLLDLAEFALLLETLDRFYLFAAHCTDGVHTGAHRFTVDQNGTRPALGDTATEFGSGTKFGCGIAQCGACTVLINGEAVRSCVYPVSAVGSKKVETIESLEQKGELSKIQKAWVENEVPQCGYCQSGMIMATTALLRKKPKPTDADIDAAVTNICRCGTFQEVRAAIHMAAKA